jgi:hypothetical protein
MEDTDNSKHTVKLFNKITTIHSLHILADSLFWLQSIIRVPEVFY